MAHHVPRMNSNVGTSRLRGERSLNKKQILNCTQRTARAARARAPKKPLQISSFGARARGASRRVQARICLLLRPLLPGRAFSKKILSYPNVGLCLGIVKTMWKSSQTDVGLLNNRLPNYYLWYLWWLYPICDF